MDACDAVLGDVLGEGVERRLPEGHPHLVETISEQLRGLASVAEDSAAADPRVVSRSLVLVSLCTQLREIAARL